MSEEEYAPAARENTASTALIDICDLLAGFHRELHVLRTRQKYERQVQESIGANDTQALHEPHNQLGKYQEAL